MFYFYLFLACLILMMGLTHYISPKLFNLHKRGDPFYLLKHLKPRNKLYPKLLLINEYDQLYGLLHDADDLVNYPLSKKEAEIWDDYRNNEAVNNRYCKSFCFEVIMADIIKSVGDILVKFKKAAISAYLFLGIDIGCIIMSIGVLIMPVKIRLISQTMNVRYVLCLRGFDDI